MKGFEQGNEWLKLWSDNQKSLFEAWVQGKPPPFAFRGEAPAGDAMNAGSHFDLGLEKLTEGPTYATLWELDRKMLGLQKLWVERARDVERYWEVVQGAWTRALERFMKLVNDGNGEPIASGRAMLDLWLATANKAPLEMHRSEEFLEAQRRMTRSSTEYRLAEREIAEAFCEVHHIPTRSEVDELQRTVVSRSSARRPPWRRGYSATSRCTARRRSSAWASPSA